MTDAQPPSTDQALPISTDQPAPIARPEDLDYEIAERAYRGTSFSPEKRARAAQEGYADDVNGLHAEMLKLAKTDEQKALLDDEIKRYQQGYLRRYTDYLISHARCMSTMIAGGSNFPVRRQQKYGQWADNKREEFLGWERRAKAAIKAKLLDARPEEAKQDAAWQALAKDIHSSLAEIQAIDTGGSPYTRSAFVNSIAGKVERLADGGDVALVDKAMELVRYYNATHDKPAISERHKFWTFGDRARQKAGEAAAAASEEPTTIVEAEGIRIVANRQADRVQIFFDDKPPEETRTMLKGEGWNWSRNEGAWQRKLTEAAKASAKRIVGLGEVA